jgi:hypothetical protein
LLAIRNVQSVYEAEALERIVRLRDFVLCVLDIERGDVVGH